MFTDLDAHVAEVFAVNPQRAYEAQHVARMAFLRRHREAQDAYRWRHPGRHAAACRRWKAKQVRPERPRSEVCRKAWITRRARAAA